MDLEGCIGEVLPYTCSVLMYPLITLFRNWFDGTSIVFLVNSLKNWFYQLCFYSWVNRLQGMKLLSLAVFRAC